MQDDFDEFSDVDELYSTLPLDEVEGLEDLVTAGSLVKVNFSCNFSVCLILYLSVETGSAVSVTKFQESF